ncbi:MAG TPA: hypothetical protein VKB59_14940 [Micromonosporaceae bacterium]|nr:hypothetical protein [Micromonosporaceae bacterium]
MSVAPAAGSSAAAKKLGIKAGTRAVVLNAPDGAIGKLEPLPDGASVTPRATKNAGDVVVLFAPDSAAVRAWLTKAVDAGKPRGLLWVCYPKGGKKAGTDLNRDLLWAQLGEHGLTGVTLVAFDDTWSAMRFRPADEVGT